MTCSFISVKMYSVEKRAQMFYKIAIESELYVVSCNPLQRCKDPDNPGKRW